GPRPAGRGRAGLRPDRRHGDPRPGGRRPRPRRAVPGRRPDRGPPRPAHARGGGRADDPPGRRADRPRRPRTRGGPPRRPRNPRGGGVMGAYTLRALRQQPQRLVASFVSLFLGATMVMAFASMFDTLVGNDGLSSTDTEALVTLGAVVGGWGLIIVVFAVASTLTLSVRQRSREMALLKSVGATPAQVGRMIVGEAAVVAVVAALAAVAPAALVGRLLVDLVRVSGQVSAVVEHRFGAVALAVGFGVTFLGATVAALVTARRTARLRARDALADAELDDGGSRLSRKRTVAAVVFLALGAQTGTLTATLMKDKGSDAMQTGGQASIWAGIGLALLAPALVRGGARLFGGLLERVGGASGYLAAHNLRRRAPQM